MLLRRFVSLALPLAILSCTPDVGSHPENNPSQIENAVFDPSTNQIPLPNDLALTPQALASQKGAQLELLQTFAAPCPGAASPLPCGFPSDQEVPITIDFVQNDVNASNGGLLRSKPDLDLSSLKICTAPGTACTLAVVALPTTAGGAPTFLPVDQPTAADYVQNGDHGTLTLHRSFHKVPSGAPGSTITTRAWDAGAHIVAAVRGGPNGVKVTGGKQLFPQPAMFLLEQGADLSRPENQTLLPGNTTAEQAANGAALEQIRQLYVSGPFPVVETVFPRTEIATMTTFQVQPTGDARPVIDASSGTVPLPSNLLLDGSTLPDDPFAPATSARVSNQPAAFGPLAPGIATLDGFSTTALTLIPLSAIAVVATGGSVATATSTFSNNVFLFDLSDPRNPVLVNPATYDELLPQPVLAQGNLGNGAFVAPLVGIQPASAAKPGTLPLKEATEYAVIVTKRIRTLPNQTPLARPSVGEIVLFNNPVYANGQSLLAGVPAAQAKILERMRAQIANVLPKLAALPAPQTTTKADIALAFTFRTQTVTSPALQLAAAPYADATRSTQIVPVPFGAAPAPFGPPLTAAQAYTKYGIDTATFGIPGGSILEVIETAVPTFNLLSTSTGAFDPALLAAGASPPVELLQTLIVVPDPTVVPACPAPPFPAGARCAPLVVFHHGLNGGRAQMLLGANALAAKGFVVAAIDAPKHGSRAFCSANTDCVVPASGATGTCTPIAGAATQGDAVPPGTCTGSILKTRPVLCPPGGCTTATDGVQTASGNYVTSGNLFRTRDTFRQDILDISALVLALSRPPTLPASAANPVTAELAAKGIVIRPDQVYWEGQSLGGILGTINVAVNSRFSEAVLNVPGGTIVDITATSPAFAPGLNAVLGSLNPPILPNTPQFLQFLQVAKWVFDPADPINFAGHILGDPAHPTLPNLLAPPTNPPQTGKKILGQMATCDNVVPNPFNLLLFGVVGLTQAPPNEFQLFRNTTAPSPNPDCIPALGLGTGAVAHAFLLDWGATGGGTSNRNLTVAAQNDAANFLFDLTAPPALEAQ